MAGNVAANVATNMAKATSGRQRIPMKKINNEEALQVCFSKRRTGLFKKACELSTLCGAELGLLVFSPAGRPYTLGLPDLQAVIDRFLLRDAPQADAGNVIHPNQYRAMFARENNKKLMELRSVLEQLRGRRQPLEQMVRAAAQAAGFSCGAEFEELELRDLRRLDRSLQVLRSHLAARAEELARFLVTGPTQILPFHGHIVHGNQANQVGFVSPVGPNPMGPTGFAPSGFVTGMRAHAGPSNGPHPNIPSGRRTRAGGPRSSGCMF